MFISEKIAFVDLHKTGCTHIRKILKQLLNGKLVEKHNQAASDLFVNQRVFWGSIRDPWEWYISLWAYGCDNNGDFFKHVTSPRELKVRGLGWRSAPGTALQTLLSTNLMHPNRWKRTYRNVGDASAFRDWLYMMHNKRYWNDLGEGFGESSISKFAGFLTYRYMKLFCCKKGGLTRMNSLSTYEQLKDYERANCFIDHFIYNENLEDDLFKAFELSGIVLTDQQKSFVLSTPKTNPSSRKNGHEYYYDSDTEKLVYERDRLIVEKFGYVTPSARR